MLDGTDLNFAYSPIQSNSFAHVQDVEHLLEEEAPRQKPVERKSIAISRAGTPPPQNAHIPQALGQFIPPNLQGQNAPQKQLPSSPLNQPLQQYMFDGNVGLNKQFEQEQKINILVNELKRRKNAPAAVAAGDQEGYFDKLMNKKKDVIKFLQSGLIVLFAFSMHFVIDHYLKIYFENNDVSFEREIFIRLLYPVAIVFIAWNIIAFSK